MPSVNVEDNIKKIQEAIEATYQELHRLQGSLRVFLGFQENGLKEIEIPEKKEEEEKESESA
tara:strand:- start:442 stop:627 length:186 start_codon:yes stop_codon:yes gene_type:complete